jgi:hypothetical protein
LCASWQPMCLSGGGFEGGFAGARVWLLFIHRFEGLLMGEFGLHRGRRGGVPSEQAPTAPGMASQRPRWQHRAGGDGGDVLRSPCVTTPSWAIARSAVVRPLRVSPNPFEGRGVEEGRERVAQCRGVTPAIPHSAGDGSTTAVLSAQRRDRFPEQC